MFALRSPIVKHYSGKLYAKVFTEVTVPDTLGPEKVVVYRALYPPNRWWCRPQKMFDSPGRFTELDPPQQFNQQLASTGLVVTHTERPSEHYRLVVLAPDKAVLTKL
jgi:hypothetical protein